MVRQERTSWYAVSGKYKWYTHKHSLLLHWYPKLCTTGFYFEEVYSDYEEVAITGATHLRCWLHPLESVASVLISPPGLARVRKINTTRSDVTISSALSIIKSKTILITKLINFFIFLICPNFYSAIIPYLRYKRLFSL